MVRRRDFAAVEQAAQASIDKYAGTSNAPQVAVSDNVKAERTNYYDVGLSHKFNEQLTVTADAYYKKIRNLLDEGQFMRNPNDPRDKNTPEPPQPKDEFVLKFVKP